MKPPSDAQRLLEEVLVNEDPLSEATLAAVLHEVRHQRSRRIRHRQSVLVLFALLALPAGLWIFNPSRDHGSISNVKSPETSMTIVQSHPLAPHAWIESSTSYAGAVESGSTVPVVNSRTAEIVVQIDDRELFALLDGQPVALVRPTDGGSPALVLVSNADTSTASP